MKKNELNFVWMQINISFSHTNFKYFNDAPKVKFLQGYRKVMNSVGNYKFIHIKEKNN